MHNSIFRSLQIDGRNILFPKPSHAEEDPQINMQSLVLIPKNWNASKSEGIRYVLKMYNNPEPTNRFISSLYQNRIHRFAQRKNHAEFYDGDILCNQGRRLNSISKIFDDSMIRKSSSWSRKKKANIVSYFTQYGSAAIGNIIYQHW